MTARSLKFERKNIRLNAARYRGPGAYFVTPCFLDRCRYGANPRVALWLIEGLRKHCAACGFDVHAYCVMPDHMHVLAATSLEAGNLIKFVESFKQDTAVEFMRRTHRHLWQLKYYDHILRASDSLERVAGYIWMNPVRQGLCRAPSEYAFLGSFTEIGQKMLRSLAEPDWTPPWKLQSSKQNDAKSMPR